MFFVLTNFLEIENAFADVHISGKKDRPSAAPLECMRLQVFGQLEYRVWNPSTNAYDREYIVGATVKVWSAGGYGDESALLATDKTFADGLYGLVPKHDSPLTNIKPYVSVIDLSFEKDGKLLTVFRNLVPSAGCGDSRSVVLSKSGVLFPECSGMPSITYSGKVKSVTGESVASAEIKAVLKKGTETKELPVAKSGADGGYILPFCGEEGISLEMVCKATGYVDQRVTIANPASGVYDFVLVADTSTCRQIGGVKICADKVVENAEGITFEGHVDIGGVLHFGRPSGKLQYAGGRLTSSDCGGLYIDNVLLESHGAGSLTDVYVYNGENIDLNVDPQAAATFTQNVANRWLMNVGFPLTLTKLQILPDGVEMGGLFWPPAWLDVAKVISELKVETFRITRSGGIDFDFTYKREAKGQLFHPRLTFEKLELNIKHLTRDDYTFYGKVKTNLGMVNPLFEGAKTSVEPVLGFGLGKGGQFRFDTLGVGLSTDYGWPIGATGFELYGGSIGVGKNKQSTDWISSIGGDIRIRPLGSKKVEAMFKAIAAPGEEFKFLDIKAGLMYQWSPYRFFKGSGTIDLAGQVEMKGEVSLVLHDDDTGITRLSGSFDFPKSDPKKEFDPIVTGKGELAITMQRDEGGAEQVIHTNGVVNATLQIPPYAIFNPGEPIPLVVRPLFPEGKLLKIANLAVNYRDREMWANAYVNNPLNGEKLLDVTARFVRGAGNSTKLNLMGNVVGLPPFDKQINLRQQAGAERTFTIDRSTPGFIVHVTGSTGAPDFKLKMPDGKIVSPSTTSEFAKVAYFKADDLKEACYILAKPEKGKYEIIYPGDLSATAFYTLNTKPVMSFTDVVRNGNAVTINWFDDDPDDDAAISLYVSDNADKRGEPIATAISENDKTNSFTFDASHLKNGRYYIYGVIEDGKNAPAEVFAEKTFDILQAGTPNAPGNLQAVFRGDTLKLSWTKNNPQGVQYLVSYSRDGIPSNVVHYGQSIALNDTNQTSLYHVLDGSGNYKVSVSAFNGELVSPPSNVVDVAYASAVRNNSPKIYTRYLSQRVVIVGSAGVWPIIVAEPDGDIMKITFSSDLNKTERRIDYMEIKGMPEVSYQPTASEAGWHWFAFKVEDGKGGVDSVRYDFLVANQADLSGNVQFSKSYYYRDETSFLLTVNSFLADRDVNARDEVDITVSTVRGSAVVKAKETGVSTGIFQVLTNLKEVLSLGERDVVTATYRFSDGWKTVSDLAWVEGALPVTFVSLQGEWRQGEGALLRWSTIDEKDNARFEVERSYNGRTFEKIGMVAGAGTTSVQQNYQFVDPVNSDATLYYRIRQVDFNEDFAYSRIVAIKHGLSDQDLVLWPNPVISFLTLDVAQGEVSRLSVTDASGHKVLEQKNGNKIDLSVLDSGLYLIKVELKTGQVLNGKFIKK